ncbi:MAG: hypothetical protein HQ539_02565 [Parcubacteria group bacterium]|nr:hypothetical protein [Parcubacteria group bacterium]
MSKVFEFHFNPTTQKRINKQEPTRLNLEQNGLHRIPFFKRTRKPETLFNTFCFFPKTRNENKLGVLYLMGELKNVSPTTQNLLIEVAEIIQQEYYQFNYETPQDCFRASLEKADQYLFEVKAGNPGLLTNLSFTAIVLLNDFSISVSKAGTNRIFLLTGKNIFDVGENFDSSDSPIRAFSNVIEGQLESTDKIVTITDELFDVFYQQEIFHELIDIKKGKQIKEIFKSKKLTLKQISGCCLLVLVKKGLPKLFLKSSSSGFVEQKKRIPHQPSFIKKNILKLFIFAIFLSILLSLGWLIFK